MVWTPDNCVSNYYVIVLKCIDFISMIRTSGWTRHPTDKHDGKRKKNYSYRGKRNNQTTRRDIATDKLRRSSPTDSWCQIYGEGGT